MLPIFVRDNPPITGMERKKACQVICRYFINWQTVSSYFIRYEIEFKKLWTGMGGERSSIANLNQGVDMGIKMTRHVPLNNG